MCLDFQLGKFLPLIFPESGKLIGRNLPGGSAGIKLDGFLPCRLDSIKGLPESIHEEESDGMQVTACLPAKREAGEQVVQIICRQVEDRLVFQFG